MQSMPGKGQKQKFVQKHEAALQPPPHSGAGCGGLAEQLWNGRQLLHTSGQWCIANTWTPTERSRRRSCQPSVPLDCPEMSQPSCFGQVPQHWTPMTSSVCWYSAALSWTMRRPAPAKLPLGQGHSARSAGPLQHCLRCLQGRQNSIAGGTVDNTLVPPFASAAQLGAPKSSRWAVWLKQAPKARLKCRWGKEKEPPSRQATGSVR